MSILDSSIRLPSIQSDLLVKSCNLQGILKVPNSETSQNARSRDAMRCVLQWNVPCALRGCFTWAKEAAIPFKSEFLGQRQRRPHPGLPAAVADIPPETSGTPDSFGRSAASRSQRRSPERTLTASKNGWNLLLHGGTFSSGMYLLLCGAR